MDLRNSLISSFFDKIMVCYAQKWCNIMLNQGVIVIYYSLAKQHINHHFFVKHSKWVPICKWAKIRNECEICIACKPNVHPQNVYKYARSSMQHVGWQICGWVAVVPSPTRISQRTLIGVIPHKGGRTTSVFFERLKDVLRVDLSCEYNYIISGTSPFFYR